MVTSDYKIPSGSVQFLNTSIKPVAVAVILLFAAEPIVFAQSNSTPTPDITGEWVLALGSKFGNCAGPINIGPSRDSSSDRWSGIYVMTCDDNSKPQRLSFGIKPDANGRYHFIGSGTYPDIFDLQSMPDGQSFVGSGSFAYQPLSASMHK